MKHEPLESIIRDAAHGDEEAFAQLHERFAAFVFKQIGPHVGQRTEIVEEISQEVWQAVHRQLPDYDAARATFSRWVTVIAVRKAITQYKRLLLQSSALQHLQANERDEQSRPRDQPARRFESGELLNAVRECTQRLEGRQQQVFQLARIEHVAIERIAHLCGITAGRVRGALSDAQRKILECLQRSGVLSVDE